ncbi:hypothetical protein EW146_g2471 [Bondarzewia mesenterica]|uniref:F-box domain-containing protein n=1 Tax=Bondarzewia mesenterica TaxID=1095465 RepID=A0A4S4M6N1_9AGAM|nr:hypothetical protein EW146_g2471 [Bondarzewia mesenterica]
MLTRSRQTPLAISNSYSGTGYKWRFESTRLALAESHRAYHISLMGPQTEIQTLVSDMVRRPAPLLEELSFCCVDGAQTGCTIPETLFDGRAPRLSCLELRSCSMPWNSPAFTHEALTTLALHYVPSKPSTAQLLQVLERTPRLQTLVLDHCLPPVRGAATQLDKSVTLSHLQVSSLRGIISDCYDFSRYIKLPPDTAIAIKVVHADRRNAPNLVAADLANIVAGFLDSRARSARGSSADLTKLVIDESVYWGLRIRLGVASPDPTAFGTSTYNSFLKYDFSIEWAAASTYCRDATARLMTGICAQLPLDHVRELYIEGRFSVSKRRWLATFGRLQEVDTVHLVGDVVYGFLRAFGEQRLEIDSSLLSAAAVVPVVAGASQNRLLPAMTRLTLRLVDLKSDESRKYLDLLRDGLAARAAFSSSSSPFKLAIAEDEIQAHFTAEIDRRIIVEHAFILPADEPMGQWALGPFKEPTVYDDGDLP